MGFVCVLTTRERARRNDYVCLVLYFIGTFNDLTTVNYVFTLAISVNIKESLHEPFRKGLCCSVGPASHNTRTSTRAHTGQCTALNASWALAWLSAFTFIRILVDVWDMDSWTHGHGQADAAGMCHVPCVCVGSYSTNWSTWLTSSEVYVCVCMIVSFNTSVVSSAFSALFSVFVLILMCTMQKRAAVVTVVRLD